MKWAYRILGLDGWVTFAVSGERPTFDSAAVDAGKALMDARTSPSVTIDIRRPTGRIARYVLEPAMTVRATRVLLSEVEVNAGTKPTTRGLDVKGMAFGPLVALEVHRRLKAGRTWVMWCRACGALSDRLATHLRGGVRIRCKWCRADREPENPIKTKPKRRRIDKFRSEIRKALKAGKPIHQVRG